MTEHRELLMGYARDGDAEAFAELVRAYAGMVYATCLRVTRNGHDAEDAAQECFLELARKAGAVKASVAGWLHAAATSRARSLVRSAASRRAREKRMTTEAAPPDEVAWDAISPQVDEALQSLPDELPSSVATCD